MPARKDIDARLIKLIEDEIAKDPFELDGHKWAVVEGLDGLADHLGVSFKTLARRLAEPPFKRRVKRFKGEARTLIRFRAPGEPDVTTEEAMRARANASRKAMLGLWTAKGFRGKVKKSKDGVETAADLYTLQKQLWGFAMNVAKFPDLDPVDAFRFALEHWVEAAFAIKQAMKGTPGGKVRYYDFPSIGPMVRFTPAVIHAYVMHLMKEGKVPAGKHNVFAAILQATELPPPLDEYPDTTVEQIEAILAAKAKKAAANAKVEATVKETLMALAGSKAKTAMTETA